MSSPELPPARRIVVTRPEPPAEETPTKGAPKLSKDEVRALLAVTSTQASPMKRAAKRGGILVIPTTILGVVLDLVFGDWGTLILLVIIAVGVYWSARPLFAKNRSDWG
ncbi:hypothetical protein BH09MYX1_BH09MYX1_16160 [soil metagenome]